MYVQRYFAADPEFSLSRKLSLVAAGSISTADLWQVGPGAVWETCMNLKCPQGDLIWLTLHVKGAQCNVRRQVRAALLCVWVHCVHLLTRVTARLVVGVEVHANLLVCSSIYFCISFASLV